ncbi:MAG: hypothetical protein L3J83_09625 [Proteobacteria bacterium]|nr:hypothetical protein [Pseudomonadota bacterium]
MRNKIYILLIILFLGTQQAKADYLDLFVSPSGSQALWVSWNGYPGQTFKVKVKQGSSVVYQNNNVTEANVVVGSGFVWSLNIIGLNCNTEYKVKVKMKGRGWRRQTVRTGECKVNKSCPFGGWYDGANCYLGSAPEGTTAFIWSGNYYYSALPGELCPLVGSWYDGANCFFQPVAPGSSPFVYANNWYYVPLP